MFFIRLKKKNISVNSVRNHRRMLLSVLTARFDLFHRNRLTTDTFVCRNDENFNEFSSSLEKKRKSNDSIG